MGDLFQIGDFTLASGAKSKWKIEFDSISVNELYALAFMLSERLEPFSYAYGVPTGGNLLAEVLNEYRTPLANRELVVDDVWTTGGSMNQFVKESREYFKRVGVRKSWDPQKAVIFARNPTPPDVIALFTMGV